MEMAGRTSPSRERQKSLEARSRKGEDTGAYSWRSISTPWHGQPVLRGWFAGRRRLL
jgi:hypothetical protein